MKVKIIYIAIGVLTGGLVGASFALGLFSGLENFLEDRLFAAKPVSPEIVILAIDSESINKIGQWPWPREIFAKAFDALAKNPPKAVGLDVVFAEPSRYGASDDALLAKSLSRASYPVILPIEASPLILDSAKGPEAANTLKTLPVFTSAPSASLGHVNLILDSDGIVRKFPPEVSFSEITG
jgi:CHASE2 domain-containing sensor protein